MPLLYFDDFYPFYPTCAEFTPPYFAIRQIDNLRSYRQNPYFSVRRNCIRVASKAIPTHAPRPYLMRSVWYQTVKSGCSDRRITAFPHFQNSFYLIVQSSKPTWYMYPIFYPTQVNAIKHL